VFGQRTAKSREQDCFGRCDRLTYRKLRIAAVQQNAMGHNLSFCAPSDKRKIGGKFNPGVLTVWCRLFREIKERFGSRDLELPL
jgi:hypothetical protein